MKRRCYGLTVYENDEGTITVRQGFESSLIAIHPDQVDLLKLWLDQVKTEILSADAAEG